MQDITAQDLAKLSGRKLLKNLDSPLAVFPVHNYEGIDPHSAYVLVDGKAVQTAYPANPEGSDFTVNAVTVPFLINNEILYVVLAHTHSVGYSEGKKTLDGIASDKNYYDELSVHALLDPNLMQLFEKDDVFPHMKRVTAKGGLMDIPWSKNLLNLDDIASAQDIKRKYLSTPSDSIVKPNLNFVGYGTLFEE